MSFLTAVQRLTDTYMSRVNSGSFLKSILLVNKHLIKEKL